MIVAVNERNLPQLVSLALELWPHHTEEELTSEFRQHLTKSQHAYFLALADNKVVGFAEVSCRNDYVEGTGGAPVGYLEGIFVLPDWRRQGVAGKLVAQALVWSKKQGCREFASDCELTNVPSQKFHAALGFKEANRLVCFTKEI